MMSEEELRSIDDWRFSNRIATRSEAVRRLCRIGLIHESAEPAIRKATESLVDAVMILSDETLSNRPKTPEELTELKALASDVFKHCHNLYEKMLEQTVRLNGLSNGDSDLMEAIEWERRMADFAAARSLLDVIREQPESKAIIEQAKAEKLARKKDGDQ